MSLVGELTTERIGRPCLPMSAANLAHDHDDDDDDDDALSLPLSVRVSAHVPQLLSSNDFTIDFLHFTQTLLSL